MPKSICLRALIMVATVWLSSDGGECVAEEHSADPPASVEPATAQRWSEAAAREQAASLHEAVHSMLRVTHDRYYREDEGLPIPASILRDVFADVKKTRQISLRWLAVEGQAMNTDHKPQDEFERAAVKALKAGRPFYERAEGGVYRRAGSIRLSNHCLKCHVPNRSSTRDRTAGLIVSMPIE